MLNPSAPVPDAAPVVRYSSWIRMFHPAHVWQWARLRKQPGGRADEDAQLRLYARLLPSGFLHYGYFEDAALDPRAISLGDLEQAQLDYALKLLALVKDTSSPILDIGCGMGGLSRLLHARNIPVVALTPDRYQASYVRQVIPDIEVQECRFEKIDQDRNRGRFGTIITSESLQYLRLDRALPLMDCILKPGGRWIACDYFRADDQLKTSGHQWTDFQRRLAQSGFRIVFEEDITPNVLPSLAFVQLLGERFVRPIAEFGALKLQQKWPRLHYLISPLIERMQGWIDRHLLKIDPAHFSRHKRYMLLVIERA